MRILPNAVMFSVILVWAFGSACALRAVSSEANKQFITGIKR